MKLTEVLTKYKKAIAISFYQDRCLGVLNSSGLFESPIARPMGIAVVPNAVAIAFRHGISYFQKIVTETASFYRQSATQYQGFVDGHELVTIKNVPILANTLFSCLSTVCLDKDFQPIYQPGFLNKKLVPTDLIHLNGIAKENDMIRYISCFSHVYNLEFKGWKNHPHCGCVWDVAGERLVISHLSLPHSPRIIDGDLWVCESGKGRVLRRRGDRLEVVINLGSFTRGMIAIDDFVLIATSKIRESRCNVQLDRQMLAENRCGIHLLDKNNLKLLDSYYFEDKKEIFDIQFIPEDYLIVTAEHPQFQFLHQL